MINIQEANYDGDYRIWVRFNTGETGIADLSNFINRCPAAKPLKDTNEFKKFNLDDWPTITWSTGFDLAPETIYELVTGKLPAWASK